LRNTDTCVGVETIFGGKEKPVLAYRYFWRNRDTCVGVETLLVENRHLCCRRDTLSQEGDTCVGHRGTFEGEKTLFKERRHFWWKIYTCVGVETLWMKRDTFTT
jgi:hypothetical protein